MRLRLYKNKNDKWFAGMYRGKGGVSSMLKVRQCKRFLWCILIFFNIKNYYKHLI